MTSVYRKMILESLILGHLKKSNLSHETILTYCHPKLTELKIDQKTFESKIEEPLEKQKIFLLSNGELGIRGEFPDVNLFVLKNKLKKIGKENVFESYHKYCVWLEEVNYLFEVFILPDIKKLQDFFIQQKPNGQVFMYDPGHNHFALNLHYKAFLFLTRCLHR